MSANPPPSTPFDLVRLKSAYPDLSAYRAACLHLAKACERGERYDDQARFVREIMRCTAQDGSEMTDEEKNLLYLAYKNIFHKLRSSYRLIARIHYNAVHATAAPPTTSASGVVLQPEDKYPDQLEEYRTFTEQQIQVLCTEITQLMENSVIKNTSRTESKVFFSKLCGDYYRYCSEVIHDKNIRVNYEKKTFEHYSYALKLAHAQLPPNHPQRLSISLNYSVCLYELLGDKKQACDLAKNAFDAAIQKLDELDEVSYKDATLIMQLLRDNLTLWTSQDQPHNAHVPMHASSAAAASSGHKSVPRASNFSFTNVGLEVGAAAAIWAALRRAILEIQEGNQGKLRFEELYRNAYTLVLHKHGDMLYRGVEECITQRLQGVAAQVAQASDTYLLDSLVAAWEDHKLKMTMMKDILMYMDKTHCKQMNLVPVYEKGLLLFRDYVVRAPNISGRFKHIMLDNVRRERDSEQIDPVLLRNSCLMLVEINIQNLDIYQREFETDLLAQTRTFYAKESQMFISENSVPDYLCKIEARLLEEEARADKYFDKSTKPKLRAILQEELLVKYAPRLVSDPQSGAAHMLTNGMVEDMGRMYSLFCREPSCLDGLRDALSALVKSTGAAIVSDRENLRVPRVFVEKVLECRAHYLRFVEHAFRQDRHFARALRDALEQFINLDTRAAQFLSLYTDDLLRKQVHSAALTDLELDEKLNQVMSIFRYLQDKDIFEDYYKQHLATRLIEHTSSSAETEKLMISKLKSECGHTLTSRLEGMFRDMDLSKQLMRTWKEGDPASQQSGGCELSVSVLTTGFWPLPPIPQCILPREAQLATDQFKRFYISQHSGRKLTWQTSMGQAELRCTFDSGKKELVVHTYQMCILMLFNSGDKLSFAEIQRATAIPPDELTRHLLSLAHPQVKLLLKNPPGKACEPTHRFKYNNKYSSNLYRNKIAVLSKAAAGVGDAAGGGDSGNTASSAAASSSSSSSSSSALPASILESRQFSVEASIVRIMKSRKTLEHNALMGEVVHQLQSKFPVEPTFVKKRIEALIEREYLERDPNNRRIYNYKA